MNPRHQRSQTIYGLQRSMFRTSSEAELLAILLHQKPSASHALDIPNRLLQRFGSMRQVLNASADALQNTRGVGKGRVALIYALRELSQRYFAATLPIGATIRNPADTETFLRAHLRDLPHELFCCLYLDNRHRVLHFEEMFRGTIDGTSVYPREIVKQALELNAAAAILAHNHPSGVAAPSQADERITRRVKAALDLVDIRLLDHLIIGDGDSTSLASRGVI